MELSAIFRNLAMKSSATYILILNYWKCKVKILTDKQLEKIKWDAFTEGVKKGIAYGYYTGLKLGKGSGVLTGMPIRTEDEIDPLIKNEIEQILRKELK